MRLSIKENEAYSKLELMLPEWLPGRHKIITVLKDVTLSIESIDVVPIRDIPDTIDNTTPFFSHDGIWEGNFIAYGTCMDGRQRLIWDDYFISDIIRCRGKVDTSYVKRKFLAGKPTCIIVANKRSLSTEQATLVIYYIGAENSSRTA